MPPRPACNDSMDAGAALLWVSLSEQRLRAAPWREPQEAGLVAAMPLRGAGLGHPVIPQVHTQPGPVWLGGQDRQSLLWELPPRGKAGRFPKKQCQLVVGCVCGRQHTG